MSNVNTQSKIPLQGPGYRLRPKGNYQAGEYRQLVNCDIAADGVVRNRESIATGGSNAATNPLAIWGNVDGNIIFGSKTQQYASLSGVTSACWLPSALPVPGGANSYHKILKVFRYNNNIYWITFEYNSAGNIISYCAYWIAVTATLIPAITFASLTRVVLFTQSTVNTFDIPCNIFMHKDRLWIVTSRSVYFSKATDPLTFAAPSGGFLNPPDTIIRYAFSLNDTIYILCDNQTLVFTYSETPDDGSMRAISKDQGGTWGCAHDNTPYMINDRGIFSLSQGYVEKVLDLTFDFPMFNGPFNNSFKLESWGSYLIIIKREYFNYDGSTAFTPKYYDNGAYAYRYNSADVGVFNYNMFLFNTDTGVFSVFDYTDRNDDTVGKRGYVFDCYTGSERDAFGGNALALLTNALTNYPTTPHTGKGRLYLTGLRAPEKTIFVSDAAYKSTDVLAQYKPRMKVEIEGFCPDGNEYFMKKFRYLEMMGKLPTGDFQVSMALDDNAYRTAIPLTSTDYTNARMHYGYRLPINQRAKAFSVKLETKNDLNELTPVTIYDQFELSDLRLLWTYTQRARIRRADDTANLGKNV